MREPLRQILTRRYGLTAPEITPIGLGHTNQSFAVAAAGHPDCVLRLGWPGKPQAQRLREERLLALLAERAPEIPAPALVRTLDGHTHAALDGPAGPQLVHLFVKLPGEPLYRWRDRCADAHLRAIMAALAQLHRALAGAEQALLCERGDDLLDALPARLDAACAAWARGLPDASPAVLARLQADGVARFHQRALAILARAPSALGPTIWTHGDFQLENFLFDGDQVVGVVDFDAARRAPRALDVALALASLTREADREDTFAVDARRWRLGARAYQQAAHPDAPEVEAAVALDNAGPLLDLFCLDQALLHLISASGGLWRLEPGIGFLACYSAVMGRPGQG